jgi:hypothetical protein
VERALTRLVPVRPAADGLRPDEAAEPALRDRLEHVLRHYGVPYRRGPDGLHVAPQVAGDADLVWNYTNKALDREWLDSHPPR